jgi:hypothetical protein
MNAGDDEHKGQQRAEMQDPHPHYKCERVRLFFFSILFFFHFSFSFSVSYTMAVSNYSQHVNVISFI